MSMTDWTRIASLAAIVNPGDRVRKQHPYDGSQRAGKPVGPVLAIVALREVQPADSGPSATVATLSDGSWEYPHNLHPEDCPRFR
jgi:hypothetical protein